jgi:hypothetical protein
MMVNYVVYVLLFILVYIDHVVIGLYATLILFI